MQAAVLKGTLCLLAVLALCGCSTRAPKPEILRLADTAADVRDLDSTSVAPAARSAYLLDGDLHLDVRSVDKTGYRIARGDRPSSGKDKAGLRPPYRRPGAPPILVIEDLAPERWKPEDGLDVPVFDAARWRELLEAVQMMVTPAEPGFGAVVDVLNEQDLFHYYDENGTLRTVPIVYKPESVRVKVTFRLDKVLADSLPVVRDALSVGREPIAFALMNTGDESEGGFPFVFLDFDRQQAVFLRSLPADSSRNGPFPLSTTISAATHLATSHVLVAFEQPVTALTRLFTLVTRTTSGMLDPRGRLPIAYGPIPALNDGPGMDLAEWEAKLDRMTGARAPNGRITTLVDGEEFFPRMIDAVTGAKESVQLRTYIFDNDDYAVRFAELLKRRSAEIDVRIMVDGLGTIGGAAAQPEYRPSSDFGGGSVVDYLRQGSKVKVRVLSNPWLAGDHTKTIIVDERIAYVGGMNIGREYRYEWHDLMLEVSGPVVDVLRTNFEKTWIRQRPLGDLLAPLRFVKPVNADAPDTYPVRVLTTGAQDTQILKAQIAAIRASRQRIYIQNAYFTSDAILYELVMARRRGVDVRVILPLRSDSGLIDRNNAIAANKMIANGVRVYIYPRMSHVKAAVYDGWACLGSANFDTLSLKVNLELNVATSHPPVVEELVQRVFLADMEKSVELTEPFPSKWSDFLTALIAGRL